MEEDSEGSGDEGDGEVYLVDFDGAEVEVVSAGVESR